MVLVDVGAGDVVVEVVVVVVLSLHPNQPLGGVSTACHGKTRQPETLTRYLRGVAGRG